MVGRQPNAPAAFNPRRNPRYSLSEAESTSGHMVLSGVPRKKPPVTPPAIAPWNVRLKSQRLNHNATLLADVSFKIYRMSQEEWTKHRESVPYVELYRYNPKHLYPKLNDYEDNGQRSLKL